MNRALMPVAEALRRVLADAHALPAETVPLDEALGRVLAEDLAALRTQPPDAVSAMDGYAVRAADVAQAPVKLKLIGEVAAGHPFDGDVKTGQAARIFTGGVMPRGRRHRRDPGTHRARRRHGDDPESHRQRPQCARPLASISRKARCCCAKAAG